MLTEAIILAGGLGTRLQSVVSDVPKPMAMVCEQPFLSILINIYRAKGIKRFILSLGHKADIVIDYFKDRYTDIEIAFVVEEQPLGTGGALRLATTMLKTDYALVLNGDSFLDVDLAQADALIAKYSSTVIWGRQVADCSRYGQIEHEAGLICKFKEKDAVGAGIINAGVYVISSNLLDCFAVHKPFSLERDYFASISSEHGFRLLVADSYFIDIGIPESYMRAQHELLPYIQ